MILEEHTLLAVLLAFVAGVALGLLWARLGRGRSREGRRAGSSSIHYILGLDLLASRQTDRAVSELTVAARKNTEAVEIFLILGNLLREKGQLERAIQIHQSVLHRPGLSGSERAHALLCLGMDFKRAGFRNRAFDTLREVIALEPDNAYAVSALIKIYEEDQDWQNALEWNERLEAITGQADATHQAFLHDQLGQEAAEQGDDARAARAYDQASRARRRDRAAPSPSRATCSSPRRSSRRRRRAGRPSPQASPSQAHLVFERLERVRGAARPQRTPWRSSIGPSSTADETDWRARLELARLSAGSGDVEGSFELLWEAVRKNPHALDRAHRALATAARGRRRAGSGSSATSRR